MGRLQRFDQWLGRYGWLIALFLVTLAAKLWLIQRFGMSLPFLDQWDAEAANLYLPWMEHRLTWHDLFAAHNEHRIFFTRIYSLLILWLNGQWDGLLEMVLNAIVHSAAFTGIAALMGRLIGRQYGIYIWVPFTLSLALPFAWENTLAGFQSQFYFLLIFSFLAIGLLTLNEPNTRGWYAGLVTAFLAQFTVGSGFLASAAVFALLSLRILKQPALWKRQVPTLIFCLLMCVLGLALKVDVAIHQVLKAHSPMEFIISLGNNLAWPWVIFPYLAPFNFAPFLVLLWVYWRSKAERSPAEEVVLTMGFWVMLQSAAAAYSRGVGGSGPGWRHMDSNCFIFIANFLSVMVLVTRHAAFTRWGIWGKLAFPGWAVCSVLGMILLTGRAWTVDIPERSAFYHNWVKNTRAFMLTDDFAWLKDKPIHQIPHPRADLLATLMRNPKIRGILPASVRDPIKIESGESFFGFVQNGAKLAEPDPPYEVSWGTFGGGKTGFPCSATSQAMPVSRLPYLEFQVAGSLGEPGVSLELEDLKTHAKTTIMTGSPPGEKWATVQVKAPEHEFRLHASVENQHGAWLAFKEPRELGRLSWLTLRFLQGWPALLAIGLGIYIHNIEAMVLANRRTGKGANS